MPVSRALYRGDEKLHSPTYGMHHPYMTSPSRAPYIGVTRVLMLLTLLLMLTMKCVCEERVNDCTYVIYITFWMQVPKGATLTTRCFVCSHADSSEGSLQGS